MALAARSQDADVATFWTRAFRRCGVATVNVERKADVIPLCVPGVAATMAELLGKGPLGLTLCLPFVPCPFLAALTFALITLTSSLCSWRHSSVEVLVLRSLIVAAT